MRLKDILVHIGSSDDCGTVLETALRLAQRHQAHLTGLHVITHRQYCSVSDAARKKAEEAGALFTRKAGESGVAAEWLCVDWPVVGGKVSQVVNLHAYSKDLVVVRQTEPRKGRSGMEPDLPERIIMGSGRPVLIVPYAGTFHTVGETAMVAWKTGRESSRALNDAMPLLLNSRQVRILSLGPAGAGEEVDRVVTHLERHGIEAARQFFSVEEVPVGDVLLNQCWEEGCDLLVVGGYTRTAGGLRLGPVADHILRQMTIPVLISH